MKNAPECCDMRGMLSFYILWLLTKKPMYGQEIAEEIAKRRGIKPTPGTIYPALKELNKKGLIKRAKKGKTIVYSLTEKGSEGIERACLYFWHAFREIFEDIKRNKKLKSIAFVRSPVDIDLQIVQTADFIRLFKYILAVAKEIGEEKAWLILRNCTIEKRIEWLEKNKEKLDLRGTEVEKAYDAFLLKYLKLDPTEVPIVKKSRNKMIYRSYNFCPVLEACKILGLDTRKICKEAYEEPTQKFLSKINPKLKFKRNYEKIRPHTDYCEEIIELEE